MIYKFEYQVESDPTPHCRFYNALDSDTATSMFEGTCEQSLTGENVVLLSVKEVMSEPDSETESSDENT